ncbi:MAG: TetR/AcrR family transcriptional regulator [Clostridiales bacterium]|nr:TetR/AcrR family transcriptional regulator [Clostridiales bacterium]
MMKKNYLTTRKLQAQKTRERIYLSSMELINEHGFDNVTIEDISQKAEVSVGAFYHHFKSKREVFVELFKMIDVYFEKTVEDKLVGDFFANIDTFFYHYAIYNDKSGVEAAKYIYGTQHEFFLDRDRYMLSLLSRLVDEARNDGQIRNDVSTNFIVDFLLTIARGVIYDWSLNNASYDLPERMVTYIEFIKPSLASHS